MFLFIFSILFSLTISLFVYFNNPSNKTAKSLLLLIIFVNLWIVFVELSTNIVTSNIWIIRFTFIFAILASFFSFVLQESFKSHEDRFIRKILSISTFLAVVFSISNFVVSDAREISNQIDFDKAILYPFVIFVILSNLLITIILLVRQYNNSTLLKKRQLGIVIAAIALTGISGTITNVVLPALDYSDVSYNFAPLSSMFLSAFLAYAILKHKFLDIRLIVARSIAYSASLLTIAALFLFLTYAILSVFFGQSIRVSQQITFFLLSLFLAVVYQPLKQFFDKATDDLFYQDNYDAQLEIDRLSEVLVSEYQIDNLVNASLKVLSESLRPTTGVLVLLDGHGEYYDEYSLSKKVDVNSVDVLSRLTAQSETVLVPDEFDGTSSANDHSSKKKLVKYLKKHGVALSVRLSTKDEIVGYLLLGPKLSGNLYNSKDRQFISTAAKELAIAVQNARRFDEIQRFNETLKLEIERATSELRSSNEKLKELDEAKDEFVTMASHQLRTPLTSVKGYVSMVIDEDVGPINDQQKDLLSSAFSSSQRMVYLIADLLNVSRLRTGKFIIDRIEVDLSMMIETELKQLKETARLRGISLVYKKPKSFPAVMLDDTKTRQVIMNFIDNAIYYTPKNGKIRIDLKATARKIEFTVTDNGIGVPKEEQPKLFSKFYRAGNAKKVRPDGTGLGLFMAKKVIIDQGGSLLFESTEGKGSMFGFSFARSKVAVKKSSSSKNPAKK